MKISKTAQALFELMVNTLAKNGWEIAHKITGEDADLWHMATGVSGEAGELLKVMHRNKVINASILPRDSAEFKNIKEELGDAEFYLQRIAFLFDVERPPERPIAQDDALNCAIEFSIVASDVLDKVKKIVVYKKSGDKLLKLVEELKEDVSQCLACLGDIYAHLDLNVEDILMENVDKLYLNDNARYGKGGYSDAAAQARADKVSPECKILE